jgi:hypothetical protein
MRLLREGPRMPLSSVFEAHCMRDLRPPDPPAAPQLPGVTMLGPTPRSVPRDPLVSRQGGA